MILLFLMLLHPFTGIHKGLYPGCNLIGQYALCGVIGTLPGQEGTLQMGHHSQMSAIGTGNACCVEGVYIVIGRIVLLGIVEEDDVWLLLY